MLQCMNFVHNESWSCTISILYFIVRNIEIASLSLPRCCTAIAAIENIASNIRGGQAVVFMNALPRTDCCQTNSPPPYDCTGSMQGQTTKQIFLAERCACANEKISRSSLIPFRICISTQVIHPFDLAERDNIVDVGRGWCSLSTCGLDNTSTATRVSFAQNLCGWVH